MTENPDAGNPTEAVMGTVAEADTSHTDDVIGSVADEHTETPEPVSVSDQEVQTEEEDGQKDMTPEEPQPQPVEEPGSEE
jgi:hypothetical protein